MANIVTSIPMSAVVPLVKIPRIIMAKPEIIINTPPNLWVAAQVFSLFILHMVRIPRYLFLRVLGSRLPKRMKINPKANVRILYMSIWAFVLPLVLSM